MSWSRGLGAAGLGAAILGAAALLAQEPPAAAPEEPAEPTAEKGLSNAEAAEPTLEERLSAVETENRRLAERLEALEALAGLALRGDPSPASGPTTLDRIQRDDLERRLTRLESRFGPMGDSGRLGGRLSRLENDLRRLESEVRSLRRP